MTKQSTEIAILTVIPEELAAARAALSIPDNARHKDNDGTIYYSGVVQTRLWKRDYGVVLTCIGGAGNSGAAAATTEVIAKYRPRAVLLMGIAAGIRGKVKLGEVVISERIIAYESTAAIRTSDGKSIEERRPEMYRWSHSMNQDIVHYQPDAHRIEQLFKQINGKFPTPPPEKEKEYYDNVASTITVKIGTIASGEKLLRDPSKLYVMREKIHGKIEVGEMEAAGFVEACRRGNVNWLVIRGISDFGDELKDDQFHVLASRSAAATLVDFITHGLDLGDLSSPVSTTHPNSEGAKSPTASQQPPAIAAIDQPAVQNNVRSEGCQNSVTGHQEGNISHTIHNGLTGEDLKTLLSFLKRQRTESEQQDDT